MSCWLDPWDDAVRSGVVVGVWGGQPDSPEAYPEPFAPDIDLIESSLRVASDILDNLTAFSIHPAGVAVDQFTAWSRVTRLTPSVSRPTRIVEVSRSVGYGPPVTTPLVGLAFIHGGAIRFGGPPSAPHDLSWFYRGAFGCQPTSTEHLQVRYEFGSTVTASARAAVLRLAHEVYLDALGDDRCVLPERTTTVQREGIGYTLLDPQTYLDKGRTGIPVIDTWVVGVNPVKAQRRATVHTVNSPPAVNVAIYEPWVRP